MNAHIVLLPGDGIGPEVLAEARQVLVEVGQIFGHTFSFSEALIGGAAIDETGSPLPDDTIKACRDASGALLGAVGGPKWDNPTGNVRPEQGLLGLRKGLELYANVRPVRAWPGLIEAAPLRRERIEGVDLIIVRELISGIYFGEPQGREQRGDRIYAVDTCAYDDAEIRRLVRLGFRLAQGRRRKVTSVDKANVMATSRLWRQVATEVGAEFSDVTLDHQLADACAMRLVTSAQQFDVIVTDNLFGDILSDEASVLAGSLGLLPSAWLGDGSLGVYEPVHGSAPDIAGQGKSNPMAAILSAAMLLRHSLALETEASKIEAAVAATLAEGVITPDLGGAATSTEVGAAVRSALR